MPRAVFLPSWKTHSAEVISGKKEMRERDKTSLVWMENPLIVDV